jgi:hypothetical protein
LPTEQKSDICLVIGSIGGLRINHKFVKFGGGVQLTFTLETLRLVEARFQLTFIRGYDFDRLGHGQSDHY